MSFFKKINLKNKTALVTGAGKGIGKACAVALAEAGANLVIISRTKKDLEKVSKIIKDFLNINCPINLAAEKLNTFFKKNKINLRVEQNYFPISQNRLLKLKVEFSASFGRQLEYYTGMVFKIDIREKNKNINIVNGGRYDKLIFNLGSNKQVPAVGAALNLI